MNLEKLLQLMLENKASELLITANKLPSIKVNGKIERLSNMMLSDEQSAECDCLQFC